MKFVIDDGATLQPKRTPELVRKAIAALQKLPSGTLVTRRKLAGLIERSIDRVTYHARSPELEPYRLEIKQNEVYYGNRETIIAARKQFALA